MSNRRDALMLNLAIFAFVRLSCDRDQRDQVISTPMKYEGFSQRLFQWHLLIKATAKSK